MRTIDQILQKLGLGKKEIGVYLATNKLGPCAATRIALEVSLPRQTVYSIINRLVEKGFVQQTDYRGTKHFFVDPERLLEILERQKTGINEQQKILEKELPSLLAEQKRRTPLPKVEFYEGETGLKKLFADILNQYRKGGQKIFRGYGINKFTGLLNNYLYDFVQERGKLGVETRLFIGQGEDDFHITDPESSLGRKVRRLNMQPQEAGFYVVGDKIYLFSYRDEMGVMIQNQPIATLFTNFFDDHWSKYEN